MMRQHVLGCSRTAKSNVVSIASPVPSVSLRLVRDRSLPQLAATHWQPIRARCVRSCASGTDEGPLLPTPIPTPKSEIRTTATDRVRNAWRNADAVCFDVDCTITVNDSLDLLGQYMGVAAEVEALTNQAMDGSMNLEQSLEARLKMINCTPTDIKGFLEANPPEGRMAPNAKKLVTALQARGIQVYLLTGGFRELVMPLAAYLGVPKDHVLANRMNWQWDDETGEPTRLVGFDPNQPTAKNRGKPFAIAALRQKYPYNTVVMVGDGITDLEAVQETGGADLFIGYGGVIERAAVASAAEWYVYDHQDLIDNLKQYRVAMIGSGAWATAAVKMMGENTKQEDPADEFVDEVRMYVYSGSAEAINTNHENAKYLPGIKLPDNVVACSSLEKTVEDADILVFCMPHQFLFSTVKQLIGKVKPGAMAISLCKGMRVSKQGPQLISQMIRKNLNIECSVLMGANIAEGVAKEELSEAVIGYVTLSNAELLQRLFQTPYFNVTLVNDVAGPEMCGTLKNVVALGAGMVDGLCLGPNTKAAVVRAGLGEMRKFSKAVFRTVRDDTFFESCGVGDLVTTCYGGRNRMVADEWTKCWKNGDPKTFDELEAKLLNGQKLQGVLTSNEVSEVIKAKGWESDYPLFTTINRIIKGKLPPTMVTRYLEGAQQGLIDGTTTTEDGDRVLPAFRSA